MILYVIFTRFFLTSCIFFYTINTLFSKDMQNECNKNRCLYKKV